MEKHTIQDGPIPLSGLSPLVVCRQWGYSNEGVTLTLPLSASQLIIVGMHEGTTKQVVSYSQTNRKWVGEDKNYAIWYIAITRS
jgi:hypothetical protein